MSARPILTSLIALLAMLTAVAVLALATLLWCAALGLALLAVAPGHLMRPRPAPARPRAWS